MSDGDVMVIMMVMTMMTMMMMIYDDDTRDEKLTVNFQLDRLGHRLRTKAIVGKASVHSALRCNNQFKNSKLRPWEQK